MDADLNLDQTRAKEIVEQLENALSQLDKLNASLAAINVDTAILRLCDDFSISR